MRAGDLESGDITILLAVFLVVACAIYCTVTCCVQYKTKEKMREGYEAGVCDRKENLFGQEEFTLKPEYIDLGALGLGHLE